MTDELNVATARYELEELLASFPLIGSHRVYVEVLTGDEIQELIDLLADGIEAEHYVSDLIDTIQDDVLDQLNDRRKGARSCSTQRFTS